MTKQFSKSFLAATSLIAALSLTSLPSIANADTAGEAWVPANRSLTQVGEAFTKNRADLIGANEIIFTSGSESNGLLFICANRKLRAGITTRPQSWETVLKKSSRRGKNKAVLLSLDGEKATNIGYFTYKPALQMLSGHNGKQAVRLYNAVVSGKKMTLDIGSKGSFDITPPKPNSAFADFGSRCGIGRYK